MPKKAPELSALEVKRLAKRVGFHAVGGVAGLHLAVNSGTAASWILRIVIGTDRADLGLGPFPEVGLAQARDKARQAREQVRQGSDPRQAKKAAAAALRSAVARALTFEAAARACHTARASEFRNRKHKADWINSLERYAFPTLGSVSVTDVGLPEIVRALEPIWTERTETATRVRQRIEKVLDWATVSGFRSGENPARWKGYLEHALPKPSKLRAVEHYPAVPWKEVAAFMGALRKLTGMGARALEFAILTAARSGEVRGATWDEIDIESKLWTIPGNRMKAGKAHRVPLSLQAVQLLEAIPTMEGCRYVFAAARRGMISDMTLSAVTRRMGVAAVPHGFRSTFKDWCRASTVYPDEVSELALAHVNSDATRAAYARDELLEQRAKLMQEWAHFLDDDQDVPGGFLVGDKEDDKRKLQKLEKRLNELGEQLADNFAGKRVTALRRKLLELVLQARARTREKGQSLQGAGKGRPRKAILDWLMVTAARAYRSHLGADEALGKASQFATLVWPALRELMAESASDNFTRDLAHAKKDWPNIV